MDQGAITCEVPLIIQLGEYIRQQGYEVRGGSEKEYRDDCHPQKGFVRNTSIDSSYDILEILKASSRKRKLFGFTLPPKIEYEHKGKIRLTGKEADVEIYGVGNQAEVLNLVRKFSWPSELELKVTLDCEQEVAWFEPYSTRPYI